MKVFLVGTADDELVLAALEQVPVAGGAVVGGMLVDGLADVLQQRDVTELSCRPVFQRPELRERVDLLLHPQGAAAVDAAAQVDGQGLAYAQAAAVHEPDGGRPVRCQPGGDRLDLVVGREDKVGRGDDAGELDVGAGRLGELLVADRLGEHRADDEVSDWPSPRYGGPQTRAC